MGDKVDTIITLYYEKYIHSSMTDARICYVYGKLESNIIIIIIMVDNMCNQYMADGAKSNDFGTFPC